MVGSLEEAKCHDFTNYITKFLSAYCAGESKGMDALDAICDLCGMSLRDIKNDRQFECKQKLGK